MIEQRDRYNLPARLERLGDRLMTACEKGEEVANRVAVCNQLGAVCRIVMTLKALRAEERRNADPDAEVAGSAVRRYSAEFAAPQRTASARAEAASDPFFDDAADPFADPAEE